MSVDWNDHLQDITGLDELAKQVRREQEPSPADPLVAYNNIADLSINYYKRLEKAGLSPQAVNELTHDFQYWILSVITHNLIGH